MCLLAHSRSPIYCIYCFDYKACILPDIKQENLQNPLTVAKQSHKHTRPPSTRFILDSGNHSENMVCLWGNRGRGASCHQGNYLRGCSVCQSDIQMPRGFWQSRETLLLAEPHPLQAAPWSRCTQMATREQLCTRPCSSHCPTPTPVRHYGAKAPQ